MKRIVTVASLVLMAATGPAAAQDRIVVGGAGGMVPLVQDLAKAYQAKSPADRIEVLANSLGSQGGIKATEAGRVAIGLTARPLTAEETGRLVYRLLGRIPAVFAVHPNVEVGTLGAKQVCDIFAGRIRSWKEVGGADARIVVLTRIEGDATKVALREQLGCFRSLRESPEAVVLTKSRDMAEALSTRPMTIGITDFGYLLKYNGRFRALELDGVAPTPDTMRAGKYKLYKEFGVVTLGEPQGLAKRFLDFATGPDGERILTQAGVVVPR